MNSKTYLFFGSLLLGLFGMSAVGTYLYSSYFIAGNFHQQEVVSKSSKENKIVNEKNFDSSPKEDASIVNGSYKCPLPAGYFVARLFSKNDPFVAEVVDYSTEVESDTESTYRPHDFYDLKDPLLSGDHLIISDDTGAKAGDYILAQYIHGSCEDDMAWGGSCLHIEIADSFESLHDTCDSGKELANTNLESNIVIAVVSIDDPMQFSLRSTGEAYYTNYWGSSVKAQKIEQKKIDALMETIRELSTELSIDDSVHLSHTVFVVHDGEIIRLRIPGNLTAVDSPKLAEFTKEIGSILTDVAKNADYRLTVQGTFPLLEWKGQKSFSEFVDRYGSKITEQEQAEIGLIHSDFQSLLSKYGTLFFGDGESLYHVYVSDYSDEPSGHEFRETEDGSTGFSYWQESVKLSDIPEEGTVVSHEVVERNKIQLQSREDRFIIQNDTVYVLAVQME